MEKPLIIEIEFGEKYANVCFHNSNNVRKRNQTYVVTEQDEKHIRLFKIDKVKVVEK